MQQGGDVLICNGNYMPITMVGEQYSKGGENKNEGQLEENT